MATDPGQRLIALIGELRRSTSWRIDRDGGADTGSRWHLAGQTWRVTLIVAPPRWIGMRFEARDPMSDRRVSHHVDTDLYDLASEHERAFADAIENEIIEFLGNLRDGKVMRRSEGSRLILTFPSDGAYTHIAAGRFATTRTRHKGPVTEPADVIVE